MAGLSRIGGLEIGTDKTSRICLRSAEAYMRDTIIIRERFPSREDAVEARQKLEVAGFVHDSINLMRVGDQYELAIHTRPENRDRVQECLSGSDFMFEARRYGRELSEPAPSPGQIALLFGVVAGIGAGVYYAYTRQRDLYAATYPSGEREAVRRLYQAHHEEHERGTDTRTFPAGQRFQEHSPGLTSNA